MSSDHDLSLGLGSARKETTKNEKIPGKHGLLLVLGGGEGVNDQLTKTHGGLLERVGIVI